MSSFLALRGRAGGGMDEELQEERGPRRFSYVELARATRKFSPDQAFGIGASIYKGILGDPATAVAVRRFPKDSQLGNKEFLVEVKILSRLRHRNLVKLLGWCHKKGERLIVYEYMPSGSLDRHLFGQTPLTWPQRHKIAKNVASALAYLHEMCEQCVIHRDVKPGNVMLDGDFSAKLGDFGLSTLVEHGCGTETMEVVGTMGYVAPETVITGRVGKESDVYSFGVLALEIACGRKSYERGSQSVVEWVRELHGGGDVLKAADERLGGEFDRAEMERLLVVGLWCAHPDYRERPRIGQVMGLLEFDYPSPDLPPQMPVVSCGGMNAESMQGRSSLASRFWICPVGTRAFFPALMTPSTLKARFYASALVV